MAPSPYVTTALKAFSPSQVTVCSSARELAIYEYLAGNQNYIIAIFLLTAS
jgi:hypothetical protein